MSYVMELVSKFTIVEMNVSLTMIARICFQSCVSQFSMRQTDSRASFTAAGGFAIDFTSDSCDFLMPLTATRADSANNNNSKRENDNLTIESNNYFH